MCLRTRNLWLTPGVLPEPWDVCLCKGAAATHALHGPVGALVQQRWAAGGLVVLRVQRRLQRRTRRPQNPPRCHGQSLLPVFPPPHLHAASHAPGFDATPQPCSTDVVGIPQLPHMPQHLTQESCIPTSSKASAAAWPQPRVVAPALPTGRGQTPPLGPFKALVVAVALAVG